MSAHPLLPRTVRLVTLGVLLLLIAGPAVNAAPGADHPAAAGPGPSTLAAPGPAVRPLSNSQAPSGGPASPSGEVAATPAGPGLQATHTVTTTADGGPGSLRQAIADAGVGDTIDFTLTYPAIITLTGGELGISKSLTILGPGEENLTVTANGASRVFSIGVSTTVVLSGLTVARGYLSSAGSGGGLDNAGTLTVSGVTFSGNGCSGYGGGGFHNTGTLVVSDSTFTGNGADSGGAIDNQGALTLTGSYFSGNTGWYGGAILNRGSLFVSDTTFTGNVGRWGGGICHQGGGARLINVTFSGNVAPSEPRINAGEGAGLYNSAWLSLTNATFSGNQAGYMGGGLFNQGTMTMTNATFCGNAVTTAYGSGGGVANYYGTLYFRNTIVANSGGGDCYDSGTIGENVANLIGDGSCSPQYSGDPNLGPLGDNGGGTWTHALLYPSDAINNGDPAICPATDQRGYPRVGVCDIGSFEYGEMVWPYSVYLPAVLKNQP